MSDKENVGNKIKKGIKNVKKVVKGTVRTFTFIASPVGITLILLAGAYLFLTNALASVVSDHITNNPISYSIANGSESGESINYINITDEALEALMKAMKDSKLGIDKMGLSKEDLRKIYAAELVSTEINRLKPGEQEEDGKFYGRVYVKRAKDSSQDLETMEYIDIASLEGKVEDYKNNGQVSADELLKYFSIEGDKICFVSNIDEQSKNVTIQKQTYKDKISQYVVPVEFLIDICWASQNPEFTLALADKVINETEINIAILQSKTTTKTTTVERYKEEKKVSTITRHHNDFSTADREYVTDEQTSILPEEGYHENSSEETVVTRSSQLAITSVKCWFMEQNCNYEKVPNTNTSKIPEDGSFQDIESEDSKGNEEYSTPETISGTNDETFTKTVTKKIEQSKRTEIETTTEKYQQGAISNPVDKTDEIVKMMKTKYEGASSRPYNILDSGSEIFFQMLQKGERTQALEPLMRYILGKATGKDYGVKEFDFGIFSIKNFNTTSDGGRISVFGTKLTKEEFVSLAESYSSDTDYVNNMAKYAGDFYDICTKEEYNINPAIAYAHACLETEYGRSNGCKNNKNYFGIEHYNNASSGKKYSSAQDSIEDYCKWIINNSTQGTNEYNLTLSRAQEFATVNSKFNGTPDSNIYVLYTRYAVLENTHICDEPDFSNPAGNDYYNQHGSNWGSGGRIYIYAMYETGGLYTGEYATRCGHTKGTDETTITERADYSVYSTKEKIKIAKTIFGSGCIRSFSR